MRGSLGGPFRSSGILNLVYDPPIERIGLTDFADMAYRFMTGIPGFGSSGFRMMGPDELKGQRLTYVKYWYKQLCKDLEAVSRAAADM